MTKQSSTLTNIWAHHSSLQSVLRHLENSIVHKQALYGPLPPCVCHVFNSRSTLPDKPPSELFIVKLIKRGKCIGVAS